jgi:hypothetical protein
MLTKAMSSNHWTKVSPSFQMLLERISGHLDRGKSRKRNWLTLIFKTTSISRSLDKKCHPEFCSSWVNPDVLPERTFAPSSVSERPLHCNINRGQETTSGSDKQERAASLKEAAVARSTSVGRSVQETIPSPSVGRKLTLLGDPSIGIRLWWLKISFRVRERNKSRHWEMRARKEEEMWPILWGLWWLLFRLSNTDWIQCMECEVCFHERYDNERVVPLVWWGVCSFK